jgi:phage shock protein PspC (stress-responsive transcriptional regulator)
MKLHRCRWDKKIAGVCGGLGQYFQIDPTIIRMVTIFLFIFTAFLPVIVAYIILWIVMPLGPRAYINNPAKKLYRSRTDRKISGICGGLADFFDIDSTWLRIGIVVLLFVTGFFPLFFTYLIGSIIIPEEPGGLYP